MIHIGSSRFITCPELVESIKSEKILHRHVEPAQRLFCETTFLRNQDDTFAIHEPPQRNLGNLVKKMINRYIIYNSNLCQQQKLLMLYIYIYTILILVYYIILQYYSNMMNMFLFGSLVHPTWLWPVSEPPRLREFPPRPEAS